MKNGDLLKEKKEYLYTRFTTKQGLFDFLVGSAIWAIIIVNFSGRVYDAIFAWFQSIIPYVLIAKYFAYLVFGVFFAIIGLVISIALITTYEKIRKALK